MKLTLPRKELAMSEPTRHFTHVWREPWIYCHPKPPRAFRREMADLLKYSTRIDALKEFLSLHQRKLARLKGNIISFGDHDMFGQMIADFACAEAELSKTIRSMMRVPPDKLTFVREDIYDSRAWCHLLLSDFVSFTGKVITDPKLKADYNGHLAPEYMPAMHFAIRHAVWTVDRTCFTAERRQKKYKQICVMNFHHADLNGRFKEHEGVPRRWVGEMAIPEGQKLKDIEPLLFEQVELECAKHYVRVQPNWGMRRLLGEPLQLGKDYHAKIHLT